MSLSACHREEILKMGIIENSFFYCLNHLNYFETGRKNPRKDHCASFLIEIESRESATLLKKQIPP